MQVECKWNASNINWSTFVVGVLRKLARTSHFVQAGSFDLLVKAYPPREGGGVGAYLCGLEPGESALMSLGLDQSSQD